jgi:hypothetical protein
LQQYSTVLYRCKIAAAVSQELSIAKIKPRFCIKGHKFWIIFDTPILFFLFLRRSQN